jgi:sucrose phosphorylase
VKNRVQLIAYANRFGGTFAGLRELLAGPLAGLFGGVHVLPFFERIDGADAGFDPIDHTRVDARLGTWSDVAALARETDVMADVIVNHVSSRSPQFLDFAERGAQSRFAGLFLTLDGVFPNGANERDLLAIYRPRPGLPFTTLTLGDGTRRIFWTTFTPEQIDIDVTHPRGGEYLEEILRTFGAHAIKMIRLDAIGYAIKKAGTSCFMLPETFELIGALAARARRHGLEVLVEVHSHYEQQIEIARHVDWVYDFALPPLVLHAFSRGTARALKRWIAIRPRNALTVLDTHDGIGVVDIAAEQGGKGRPGLVAGDELDRLVADIHASSRGESARATGAAASNLDLYQVNCTFYDALGRDDRQYLLARAIQFFLPGVPQVYYVGLLAGTNDMALLARTGVGRDINRHCYTRAEIDEALARPCVQRLFDLIRLRNEHAAFGGAFEIGESPDDTLDLSWRCGEEVVRLTVNVATCEHRLEYSSAGRVERLELGGTTASSAARRSARVAGTGDSRA